MVNQLADALSPYLRQHADNPVDWREWGEAARAEARRRDVPLLVSVGYSACHWCHVMAHESFADPAVAEVVNAEVVAVKVDREERPDVDAVYMTATQAMTGQGGWPMTVFATPDGEPFWCGTYLPREQFVAVVRAVGEAWRERRDQVVAQGAAVVDAVRRSVSHHLVPPGAGAAPDTDVLDAAAATLHGEYDAVHGGFGGAPKFPPSMVLEFLLRHHARTGDARSLEVARGTCDRMARGGMYDQLAGGFARYAVDATWTVPHFEKMLYDNALLLRAYTHLWRDTGDRLAGRVAAETAGFLLADLRAGAGFAAALDADTDGVEGATYVWTPEQLRDALGAADGDWAAGLLAVGSAGTFERGTSVLALPADPADPDRWRRVRDALRAARDRRPQPARDDKVVAAWNGLAVTALTEYAMVADAVDPGTGGEALAAARGAARYLLDTHLVGGRLRRVSRDGAVGAAPGVLDDHGCLAQALCALHQADAGGGWLEAAGGLLDTALARFGDGDGGFFDTANDAERLVSRPAEPTDNATPSGLSALAEALATYAALTGSTRHREVAERAVAVLAPIVARYPRFAGHALAVAEGLAAGPYQVAIVAPANAGPASAAPGAGSAGTAPDMGDAAVTGAAGAELRRAAWRSASPGAVVVYGRPDQPGVPLLADRPLVASGPAAYVCRGFVCDRPVTTPAELTARLART